jgi:hypothetical protein
LNKTITNSFFLKFKDIFKMDLDRTILDEYKAIATQSADYTVKDDGQGRWSMEMFAGLLQKILNEGRRLAQRNRRGTANILVCTPSVVTALEVLGKFRTVDMASSVAGTQNQSIVYAGTLLNGIKVYVDYFASEEFAMPIYKGANSMDAGLIYSPYQPISLVSATDPKTMQPVVGIISREGISRNTLLDDEVGSAYCTYFSVNFSGTSLA